MSAALCSVTADLIQHDRKEAQFAKRERFVDLEVERMTSPGGEYDPMDGGLFLEALQECDDGPDIEAMHKALFAGDHAAAGRALEALIRGYAVGLASSRAETDADKATCKRCFDTGCPVCDPQEER